MLYKKGFVTCAEDETCIYKSEIKSEMFLRITV